MHRFFEKIPFEQRMIHSMLERAAAERSAEVFFTYDGTDFTNEEVNSRANQIARNLQQRGVGTGTRVAVMMDNHPEYVGLWFALAKLGATEVPINTAYSGDMLRDQLDRASVTHVVADDTFSARFDRLAGALPQIQSHVVNATGTDVAVAANWEDFQGLYGGSDAAIETVVDPRATGCIIYTSGTTGPSKGVLLTHHHEATFGMVYADIVRLEKHGVALNYLPYFHIAGKFLTTACLLTGAKMMLVPKLSIDGFWDLTRAGGVTNFIAVGGVCNMLFGQQEREDDADNPVQTVYAVPAPSEIYERFEKRFDLKLVEAYGSTETNLVIHTDLDESKLGSCGRVHPMFDVRLVDDNDQEVATGSSGEIIIRPRQPYTTMAGYDGMPEQTLDAWRNLWFHTGDRARKDEDGYFYFLDRMKDSIRRRGENISSYEVERLVGMHPSVAESAAVPVPSELGEDEVKVVVVRRQNAEVTHEELLRFCVDTMPYFMVPRFIEFAEELERTPTNKVEKYKLRQSGVTEDTWDCQEAGWRVTRSGLVPNKNR